MYRVGLMSLLMIHEAYMPVYMGSRFSLRTGARAGPPEVVQEALADLKSPKTDHFSHIHLVFSYLFGIIASSNGNV